MAEEKKVTFGTGSADFQQAEWLAFNLEGEWRYDHTAKSWHHWDGTYWAPDQQRAIELTAAEAAHAGVGTALLDGDENLRKALVKLYDLPSLRRALEALATMPGYSTDGNDWDTEEHLLGCKNGILDLRTNELVPNPGPELLVTKTTGHNFRPIAGPAEFDKRAPVFMRVLREWMSGDEDMVHFLLFWFGASLFGFTPEQKFLLMTGRGRNGKGALKTSIINALGDYADEPSANLYMRSPFGAARSDQARADLMKLKGLRLAFFSDPEGHKFNEELLKAHTGGDRISARALHSNNIQSWAPTHTVTFLLNDAPELDDLGPSMGARVMVADFRENYLGREDRQLYGSKRGKLEREAEGILAILAWAASIWYAKWDAGLGGIELPERVTEQSKQFMERNDVIANWLTERGELGRDLSCPSQLAYESYLNWHVRSGEEGEPMSMTRWSLQVQKKGFTKKKTEVGMRWQGFKLLGAMELADRGIDEDETP